MSAPVGIKSFNVAYKVLFFENSIVSQVNHVSIGRSNAL